MNKNTERLPECPTMKILLVSSAHLKNAWRNTFLSGHYWRLYHNEDSGAGVYLHGKKFEMTPDKMYLLAPQCELRTWSDSDPRQIYIHFEMDRLTGHPEHLCSELPLTERFAASFSKISAMLDAPGKSAPWRLSLHAFGLAAEVLESMSAEMLCEPDADERISFVRDRICNYPSMNFTLKSMAREAGMPQNAFLIRFREITGVTPYQYLLSVRYTTAARLLKDGGYDIDTVCEMVGVKDRFHFSRRFRRLYGIPPGAYSRT